MNRRDEKTYFYDSHPVLASGLFGAALGATVGGLVWLIASVDWVVAVILAATLGVLAGFEWYLEMSGGLEPSPGSPRWLGSLHAVVVLGFLSTLVIRAPQYRLVGLMVAVSAAVISIGFSIYDLRRRHSRSAHTRELDELSNRESTNHRRGRVGGR